MITGTGHKPGKGLSPSKAIVCLEIICKCYVMLLNVIKCLNDV